MSAWTYIIQQPINSFNLWPLETWWFIYLLHRKEQQSWCQRVNYAHNHELKFENNYHVFVSFGYSLIICFLVDKSFNVLMSNVSDWRTDIRHFNRRNIIIAASFWCMNCQLSIKWIKNKFDYCFHSSVVNQSLLSNYLVIRYTRKLQDIVLKITFISIFQLEKKGNMVLNYWMLKQTSVITQIL